MSTVPDDGRQKTGRNTTSAAQDDRHVPRGTAEQAHPPAAAAEAEADAAAPELEQNNRELTAPRDNRTPPRPGIPAGGYPDRRQQETGGTTMNTRLTRVATAALAATALALGASPAHAGQSNGPGQPSVPSTWTCRQYGHVIPYTYHGVQSDACDGYYPGDNHFMGEVVAEVWNRHGVLKSCTVQLNRVVGHRAYPLRGYNHTEQAYSTGHLCDAQAEWKLPRGYYNVTTEYLSTGGVFYTTVQGPVIYWPGS